MKALTHQITQITWSWAPRVNPGGSGMSREEGELELSVNSTAHRRPEPITAFPLSIFMGNSRLYTVSVIIRLKWICGFVIWRTQIGRWICVYVSTAGSRTQDFIVKYLYFSTSVLGGDLMNYIYCYKNLYFLYSLF